MKKITLYFMLLCGLVLTAQNNSLHFDSVDDTVDLQQNFAFEATDSFTIEAWIKLDVNSNVQQIISKLGYANNNYTGWGFQLVDGLLSGYVTEVWFVNTRYVEGTQVLAVDTWYHVAMTYNDDQTITLFINGVEEPLSFEDYAGTVADISIDAPTQIGSYEGSGFPGEYFRGSMDDFRIWDVAKTPSEILASYTTEISGTEPNLIGYYKMDINNSSCDVQDCSTNQFHGTRIGSAGPNDVPQFSENVPPIDDLACGSETSCELGISDIEAIRFSIVPNPSSSVISISGIELVNTNVRIYNTNGIVVLEEDLINNSMNISNLSKGVYFVSLTINGTEITRKIIKN